MSVEGLQLPWQHSFPPFYSLQPHAETRAKQIAVWRTIVLEYFQTTKQYILNVNDAARNPPFKNTEINRKLDVEFILAILSDLQRTQNAAPRNSQRNSWDIYWHTLDEWAAMIYSYVSSKGMLNAVLTLFELTQGDDITEEEFYGLDMDILIKCLRVLESKGSCELILYDDHQGVKFF